MANNACSEAPDAARPKAAPAPGVPMNIQEYERLKEQAKNGPAPKDASAQEDHPKPRR